MNFTLNNPGIIIVDRTADQLGTDFFNILASETPVNGVNYYPDKLIVNKSTNEVVCLRNGLAPRRCNKPRIFLILLDNVTANCNEMLQSVDDIKMYRNSLDHVTVVVNKPFSATMERTVHEVLDIRFRSCYVDLRQTNIPKFFQFVLTQFKFGPTVEGNAVWNE